MPPEAHICVDCMGISDLSSGCDFLTFKLNAGTKTLSVENRKRTNFQTLFTQPNVKAIR